MATPYSPPASSPSRQASTEWAQPRWWRSVYAVAMSSSIQPPVRSGSAQPATTSANAVSTRSSKWWADCRIERLTRSPSSGSTPRGSGDHHAISAEPRMPGRSTAIGNRPRR